MQDLGATKHCNINFHGVILALMKENMQSMYLPSDTLIALLPVPEVLPSELSPQVESNAISPICWDSKSIVTSGSYCRHTSPMYKLLHPLLFGYGKSTSLRSSLQNSTLSVARCS
jgi:hypothetical protein